MNQRKVKALKRALSEPDERGRPWYESYVKSCVASSRDPFGLKKIKRMAKGIPMKDIRSGKFLQYVEDVTWN